MLSQEHPPFKIRRYGGSRTPLLGFHRAACKPLHHMPHVAPSVPRPGFEPGTPRSKRGVIPFHHQGKYEIVRQLQTWELNPESRLMRPERAPARLQNVSGDGGIRTHTVHVLSVATPAGWSTSPAPLAGFEPATSTVTKWRALQTAPQGLVLSNPKSKISNPKSRERPVGVEPTHPPWRGDRQPLHHGREISVRPEGLEPSHSG